MDSVTDYFTVFPNQSDPDFNRQISAKQEFREIAHEGKTVGPVDTLFNNQELVVRLMSPGTGMKRLFMDSYMGTGKTRPPYIIMERYLGVMPNKPLILLPGDAIDTVHFTEIRQIFNNPNMSTNEINRKYEFFHYTSFANHISGMLNSDEGKQQIIREYGNRVIFGDEIHYLRDIKYEEQEESDQDIKLDKNGTMKVKRKKSKQGKKTYRILNEFFHLVADSSVTILATGTSKMDSAAEISMINMLLPENRQINIKEIKDVVRDTTDATFQDMLEYFKPYFNGIMFYIQLDPSTMPPMIRKGDIYESGEMRTREPIVLHVMRENQQAIYRNVEVDVTSTKAAGDKKRKRNIHSLSYALAWTFPPYKNKDQIRFEDYAESLIKDTSSSSIGRFKDDPAIKAWADTLTSIDRVKDYSIKFGDLLEDILATPTRQRFMYLPYVEMGVVIFGMLLEKQGYQYYNGVNKIPVDPSAKTRRYTVIWEGTTSTRIKNIVSAANMKANMYGDYLHVILGSPKSGVGISFTNARAMDLTRGTWHKGQEDQATARVFRATSLENFDKTNEHEYNIEVGRHATVGTDFPFTKDVEMFFVSDEKTEQIVHTANAQVELCVNTYLSSYRNKNIPASVYDNLKVDYSSYILGGYARDIELEILSMVKLLFIYNNLITPSDVMDAFPSEILAMVARDTASLQRDPSLMKKVFPLPIVAKVLGDLVDRNILVRDRWGRQMFVKNDGDGRYFLQDGYTSGSQAVIRPELQLGNRNYYEREASIFSYIRPSILRKSFLDFIKETEGLPDYEFVDEYLNLFVEIKIVSLEMLLIREDAQQPTHQVVPDKRRELIIATMRNNWFLIHGMNCVVHILDQINIDRVHYTANVSNIENTGKLRIYCYDDESPAWRFVRDEEAQPIIDYINDARRENENYYRSKSKIYGIINTTDNNFRIYDASDKESAPGNKNLSVTGYVCMEKKKQAMLPMLWKFRDQIKPPESVVNKYKVGKSKQNILEQLNQVSYSQMQATVLGTKGLKLSTPINQEQVKFYFYWLDKSVTIKKNICPALRHYFQANGLLFVK